MDALVAALTPDGALHLRAGTDPSPSDLVLSIRADGLRRANLRALLPASAVADAAFLITAQGARILLPEGASAHARLALARAAHAVGIDAPSEETHPEIRLPLLTAVLWALILALSWSPAERRRASARLP